MDGAVSFPGTNSLWLALLVAIVVACAIIALRGAAIVRWLEKKAGEHAEKRMPPSNKLVFERRIARRVRWLQLKDWWRHKQFRRWLWDNLPRPLGLAAIFTLTLLMSHWFLVPLPQVGNGLRSFVDGTGTLRGQTVLIVFGIPIAFVLWWFRDMRVRVTLDNQRKDVNLKEFQEIQMRAAGAIDEKLPASARESLQIAATHQLAGFLKGEYGTSFRRPAWELLRARLLASSQRVGYQKIPRLIAAWHEADPAIRKPFKEEISDALSAIRMDSTGKALRDVVKDEWRTIFGEHLPLPDTVFDGVDLPFHALLGSRDLSGCSFIRANLVAAHLEGAFLISAHLEGANLMVAHLENAVLMNAHLEGAYMFAAHLEGAILGDAHLEGADLVGAHLIDAFLGDAHLEGANLVGAHLEGAYLVGAHLEGADLVGAHLDDKTDLTDAAYDDATQFADDWDTLSDEQKDEARAPWIKRGLKHIDELAKAREEHDVAGRRSA